MKKSRILIAIAVATAALCVVAGALPAAAATTAGRNAAAAGTAHAGDVGSAYAAARAVAAGPASAATASALASCTTPLLGSNHDCASTNPLVDRWWDANSGASSCTISWAIDWGDGTSKTVVFTDATPGLHLLGSHTYSATVQKTYTETLTSTVLSGPCTGTETYIFHFTLLAYVALGDSYSAGLGAGGYDFSSGACYRSGLAYPYGVNLAMGRLVSGGTAFVFKPCSGATVSDFFGSEGSEPPQISFLEGIPAHSVGLVTLTIGGNDLGFVSVMSYCATRKPGAPSCQEHSQGAVGGKLANFEKDLSFLFARIKGEPSLASDAKVVVLGYPQFFPPGQPAGCPTGDPYGGPHTFLRTDMAWIDGVIKEADADISRAAGAAGFTYVPTSFSGHQLCQPDPWLNAATVLKDGVVKIASFHPNAAGQDAFARTVEGALGLPVLP